VLTPPGLTRYDFDQRHAAWQVVLGVQPLPWLGAELAYLDLGHPHVNTTARGLPLVADAEVRGEAAFVVAHLPNVPLPRLHVYGKLGVAHLRTTANATDVGHPDCTQVCTDIAWIPGTYRLDATSTDLAYGAGVQLKLAALGVRLEYERVSVRGGDPDLLSAGVTWRF